MSMPSRAQRSILYQDLAGGRAGGGGWGYVGIGRYTRAYTCIHVDAGTLQPLTFLWQKDSDSCRPTIVEGNE